MTGSQTLVFRADASVPIGTGHAMRCLALAHAWQDAGGKATFAMAETTPAIRSRLLAESCKVMDLSAEPGTQEDLRQTIALAQEQKAEWVVVDGYRFSADYQRALKAAGCKVLFIDDYGHAEHYWADVVLNQNVSAHEGLYKNREPQTRLLLGTQYCMLRREFNLWRDWKRKISTMGHKVLITMGGSDSDNVTLFVMQALQEITAASFEVVIVIGGSNPHLASIEHVVRDSRHSVRIIANSANMPEWMAWADLAVSAAGSTCWEICALGLPALLICVAENQAASARSLADLGAALFLDTRGETTTSALRVAIEELEEPSVREKFSRLGRKLVDFSGAVRVATAIAP